jgi:hypothetical protein
MKPAGPPAILILLPLEQKAPGVLVGVNTEGDEHRMWAWLESQPQLHELVERALELGEEARAA